MPNSILGQAAAQGLMSESMYWRASLVSRLSLEKVFNTWGKLKGTTEITEFTSVKLQKEYGKLNDPFIVLPT